MTDSETRTITDHQVMAAVEALGLADLRDGSGIWSIKVYPEAVIVELGDTDGVRGEEIAISITHAPRPPVF